MFHGVAVQVVSNIYNENIRVDWRGAWHTGKRRELLI